MSRKAFNFYRSYYDVARELSDKDRAAFLWAICQRQFEGVETELNGLAKIAYISQKHNIDSQVFGYENKTNTKLTPTEGGSQGGSIAPTEGGSVQEKEKVKKSKNPFTESEIWFLDLFNSLKAQLRDNPRPHKSISETGRRNLQKLLDTGHLQPDFEHAITAMLGADWAKRTGNDTPDHLLREENFLRYLNVQSLKQVQYGSDKPNNEEQWSTAFDTLKQFYTPEQQPTGD